MEIFTIGFREKTAQDFFEALRKVGIKRLLDIRLHNTSPMSRFTRRDDLPFLLNKICNAEYIHKTLLAPSEELFQAYQEEKITWSQYERRFLALMEEREIEKTIDPALFSVSTVLLCSEPTPDKCHRRLVLEYLNKHWGKIKVTHL